MASTGNERQSKVIGCFAYASPAKVVCTDKACVIAGSEAAMQRILVELDPGACARHTIRKTRFGEILAGMRLGAVYAFDEEAYQRFYPLAKDLGLRLTVEPLDFAAAREREKRFIKLQLKEAGSCSSGG